MVMTVLCVAKRHMQICTIAHGSLLSQWQLVVTLFAHCNNAQCRFGKEQMLLYNIIECTFCRRIQWQISEWMRMPSRRAEAGLNAISRRLLLGHNSFWSYTAI